MNFGSVTINGKATEAFSFCMKNSTGEYKWYYIYGGAGITTSTECNHGSGAETKRMSEVISTISTSTYNRGSKISLQNGRQNPSHRAKGK